jgi:conjugative relaxase-like TrwC/TraI family protein
VAWMRMMGEESVAYHRSTVLERGDDHLGQALAYYASRGETLLMWGGAGASLGLSGPVDPASYEAIFGPGGARNLDGGRLVSVRRPGMELVISVHKSVAELGVIGRAEDMHSIMDAEREATLSYLDQVTKTVGGRRGRASIPTRTGGLIFAHTRHATSRAGDPCPHDHVLVANVVEMLDERGGWKAANTSLWREHLHAATMVGRVAAARKAVELGYGIAPDRGPSGRLGQWRIAGIPDAVLELHSKRAAEITAAVEERGDTSYRARQVAARTTRAAKEQVSEGELVARWQAELAEIGWSPDRLNKAVEAKSGRRIAPRPHPNLIHKLLTDVLGEGSDLARRKVFSRRHLIVALAPHLYGWTPQQVEAVVRQALASPAVVPLIGVPGAIEATYSLASVLATEAAIADSLDHHLARADAPTTTPDQAIAAIAETGAPIGGLSDEQAKAAERTCTSGRGAELVVGVAGAGKTTLLAAVAAAFEASGCEVVGTATAGQAARNLATGANMTAHTLASLTGQLARGERRLGERSVVILDEAGMTDDTDLARLLAHVQVAGAKLVMVGDHRQLAPVGPGGALAALVARHPDAVHPLGENRRQADPDERRALDQLRDGDVTDALAWYASRGRIRAVPDRNEALQAAVDAWAADTTAGHTTALLAWRRTNVAELNHRARDWMAATGRLTGPELVTPGGVPFQAGDRVVALAPDHQVGLVTSQRGTVQGVDTDAGSVAVGLDDGRHVTLTGEQLGPDRLGHGYATTVHRAQGVTVDHAHLYADGGGRELAYVAMSRARHSSTAWVVADDPDQAAEDVGRDWSTRRTPTWAIDTGLPNPHQGSEDQPDRLTRQQRDRALAIDYARHRTRAGAVAHSYSKNAETEAQLAAARATLAETTAALVDLPTGDGVYRGTPVGQAADEYLEATVAVGRLQAEAVQGGWGARRQAKRQLPEAVTAERSAGERLQALIEPEQARLHQKAETTERAVSALAAILDRQRDRQAIHDRQRAAASAHARRSAQQIVQSRRPNKPAPAHVPAQAHPGAAISDAPRAGGPSL